MLPIFWVPFQVTSGPAMLKIGPMRSAGVAEDGARDRVVGAMLHVILPAKRSRVGVEGDHRPDGGLPGEVSSPMTVRSSVRLVRLYEPKNHSLSFTR